MPFKSQAQRAKFHALVAEGKMSEKTLNEFESATPKNKKLPERLSAAKKPKTLAELKQIAKEKLRK